MGCAMLGFIVILPTHVNKSSITPLLTPVIIMFDYLNLVFHCQVYALCVMNQICTHTEYLQLVVVSQR